jgi:hypothetical protein
MLNLALSKFCNNLKIFINNLFFPLFSMIFGIVKPNQKVTRKLFETKVLTKI